MMRKRMLFSLLIIFCVAILSVSAALADLSLNQKEIEVDFVDSRITDSRTNATESETAGESIQDELPVPVQISSDAVRLELKPASGGNRYNLWINGNELNCEQEIGTAVDFCEKCGIPMERYSNGNGHSGIQEIALIPDLPLLREYAFYVDQGAGPATGKLHTVRMYFEMRADPSDTIAREAQDIYKKLEAMLGKATQEPKVYAVNGYLDLPGIDLAGGVRKMYSLMNDSYCFVYAGFSNLDLYVSSNDGKISIYLNLSVI